MLSALYSLGTRWRRRHPGRVRRLGHPVISIGNIAAGGRAKSPMAQLVARALLDAGERPAILSRGYARARRVETPVVVRDVDAVRAGIAESGDEPLMLAEALDGAIVVVHPDRARAGRIAEDLGATMHILDDGFQHVRLHRDIDIVMIEPGDFTGRVMPAGRLREPVDALAHANAVVVLGDAARGDAARDHWMALAELSDARVFSASRHVEVPPTDLQAARGYLVSGLADNAQFAAHVAAAGWAIAGTQGFKDHHRYTATDAADIRRKAAAANASFVLTTAKDTVRLRDIWNDEGMPLQVAALTLGIDGAFGEWLIAQVRDVREAHTQQSRRAREEGSRRAS